MNQLDLSRLGDDLAASIHRVAEREKTSVDEAAIKLLRKGAEIEDQARKSDKVGNSLDHLFGKWSVAQAEEIDGIIRELDVVDESIWR